MRTLFVLTSALILTSASFAQNPFPLLGTGQPPQEGTAPNEDGAPAHGPFILPTVRDYTLSRNSGFRRALAGRFTRIGVPDVAMLDGTSVTLVAAPAIHDHMTTLPGASGDTTDIAVLAGHGDPNLTDPLHDALVLVGPPGLRIWRWVDDIAGQSLTSVSGVVWPSVQRIATHPTDTNVIYGLTYNSRIAIAESDSAGFATSATTWPLPGGSPLAVVAVDWNKDGDADVAALTTDGLYVYERDGTSLASVAHQAASGDITLVRTSANETVAWLRPAAAGGSELAVHGNAVASTITLDDDDEFVAISAGDWTGDGYDEVVVSTDRNKDVSILINLSASQPQQPFAFYGSTGVRVAIAAADASRVANSCAAAVGDFDGDGDTDIFAPVEKNSSEGGDSRVILADSKQFFRPGVTGDPPLIEEPLIQFTPPGFVPGDTTTTPPVPAQLTVRFHAEVGGNITHTQILAWTISTDPATEKDYLDTSIPVVTTALVPVPVNPPELQEAMLLVSQVHLNSGSKYCVMARPVIVNGGQIVEVGEATLAITVTDNDGPNERVEELPPTDPPTPPGQGENPPGGG